MLYFYFLEVYIIYCTHLYSILLLELYNIAFVNMIFICLYTSLAFCASFIKTVTRNSYHSAALTLIKGCAKFSPPPSNRPSNMAPSRGRMLMRKLTYAEKHGHLRIPHATCACDAGRRNSQQQQQTKCNLSSL